MKSTTAKDVADVLGAAQGAARALSALAPAVRGAVQAIAGAPPERARDELERVECAVSKIEEILGVSPYSAPGSMVPPSARLAAIATILASRVAPRRSQTKPARKP
jgi:hypothetical protein